ncbi:MAG: iron-containing redox enzyme family protein [Alphaproteobacteria bacterium]|nr:iron-containing redox enzyme family protein [Alphaproteobacteria bacterium]MBV9371298.1 iron-containing redox enzyme family protein [Alphaproteobacteria bacterium]MBV9901762.1 iron-containing redox enzyme family protein [Alphaproteobacteria bacterium]
MATAYRRAESDGRSPFLNDGFQRKLARWNRRRLAPGFPSAAWTRQREEEARLQAEELGFLDALRSEVTERAAEAPDDPDGFIAWFEALKESGPGQGDPLFPWLAETAGVEPFRYFLEQEAAGEAGFDDLTALTLVRMPATAKMELANNFWDEMGRGNPKGMHGPMLSGLLDELGLAPEIETTVWESLALANAMTAMAANRGYAWHSVGALGAIELTAPGRSRAVADGLRRLGFGGKARRYFELHATLDLRHSADWNAKVLRPLVEEEPRRAAAIAEGALIRLAAGARCFARYRRALWSPGTAAG